MVPGFKYHAVTVSAIFIALTIGLVLGSVFVSPSIVRRQEIAIKNLQHTLNNDVEEKTVQIKQYQECVATISPMALQGRLANASIALILVGDYPDAASRANDALQMAGAKIITHITVSSSLNKPDAELNSVLANLHSQDARFTLNRATFSDQIASILAHGDSLPDPFLRTLEKEGFVRLTQEDTYNFPVRFAVLVVGSRSATSQRAERVDVPLIHAFQKQGITVVACEPQDTQFSEIPVYRALKADISTVDNVDTDMGRLALVLALLGEKGDYGVKPTASHVLPAQSTLTN